MKTYIEEKIKAIESTSDPRGYLVRLASGDTEIRRMWKTETERDNICWRNINTNDDVIDLIDRFDGCVYFVEENVPFGRGHIEDGYNMALAEYRALQGLRKLAQFIDTRPFNNTNFMPMSENEIDELFNRMNRIIDRMNQQNLRRAMQD